jgi:lysophospholipase L1-like esterase
MKLATFAVCLLLGLSTAHAQTVGATPAAQPRRGPPPPPPPLVPNLPTLFVVGDSTAANNNNPKQVGWGIPFAALFDPAKINIANRARGGRSSRTFITEGLWDKVLAEMKPGDIVLLQFGHNDAGPVNDNFRARGSVKGLGEETEEIDNLITKKHEIIHTFGWYMRKMIADTKAKGATPIVLGLTVRDIWHDGTVERGPGNYTALSRQIAHDAGVKFMDLTSLIASRYEQMGQAAVKPYFPGDSTHTNIEGATLNAALVVSGLLQFSDLHLDDYLSDQGRAARITVAPVTVP